MHTIELNTVMLDGFQESPATLLLNNDALLLSASTHQIEDEPEGDTHEWRDDGKSTISPPPGGVIQKALTKLRTSKLIDDIRRGRESQPDSTVPQVRGIRNEDVENIVHAIHSRPVEDLGCSVGLHILADAHHDKG